MSCNIRSFSRATRAREMARIESSLRSSGQCVDHTGAGASDMAREKGIGDAEEPVPGAVAVHETRNVKFEPAMNEVKINSRSKWCVLLACRGVRG